MGIERTSESLVPSQKNEAGKYLTTDGTNSSWSEVSGSSSGVTSLSGTLNEIEVSASVGNITLSLPSTINANTTGSAATLTTPRSIGLSGDVSGSANFDGSSNITITATVADDSHNHIISNVDGLQTALDGKQTLDADLTAIAALSGTSGFLKKTAADTWSLDTNTYLTGNQTITLTGDATGSGTTSIVVTVADDSHNHIISNVDGLQTALDAKLDSTSYTASDVLTKIKTVDGSTSGLDSDLLDGQEGSYYLDWTNTTNKPDPTITLGGDASGSLTLTDLAGGTLTVTIADDSHNHIISNVDGLQTALDAKAPLESPALTGTPTAPTASASANSTQIATTAFVQTAVSNLINGAPGALDTLDELAFALGDDANFASTVTNSLAGKQPIDADLTAIAGLSASATGFLKKDGDNSWSLDGSTYLTGNQTITLSGDVSGSGTTSINVTVADDSHNHIISNVDGLQTALDSKLDSTSYTAADVLTKIKTVDGATSGLDADLLDGQHGSYYLDWNNTTNKPDPTITLLGDVSGSATFTDLTSASVNVTIQPNSVELGTDTTGNYVATASAGSGIEISGSGSENADLTIINTGVTSLTGTANEVEVSASAGAVQVGLPNEVRIESLGAGTASVDVTVENTTFIAVAINSSAAASSADGITWTDSTMPSSQAWRSASYGNGKFVAVAATNSAAATSTDGINWTARTMPSFQNWRSVAYGNSTFVAVAYLSAAAATSTDGITWTARTMPSSQRWRTPFYANNIFVAVASSSAAAATSTDGITWTARTMPSSQSWRSVSYGNSTFVAVSYNLAAATSTDGITWTARTMPSSQSWRSASYGNGRFVAIAINSAAAATSTDGITWTDSTMPSSQNWISVDYGNDIFVAVAYNSAAAATSTDGITWTARTMPSSQNWQSASYGNITTTTITPIAPNLVPTQTGNSGKYLTTDGTNSSWSSIPESLSPFLLGGM